MGRSQTLGTPALDLETRKAGSKALRLLGITLSGALWLAFIAMALHTSRYPAFLSRYSKEYAVLLGLAAMVAGFVTLLQIPRIYSALYRNRFTLFWLLVVSPILTLSAIEAAMRSFNLLGSEFYSEIRRYMSVLTPDEHLYFRNPVRHRARYQGVEIETNDLGLRDRSIDEPSGTGERILVLGDSVAFGWGVKVEDAFPRQLEKNLTLKGHRARTINSAVPGYNSHQELAFLNLYETRIHPDRVVLLYVDNDIDAIDPARVHMGVRPDFWKDPKGVFDYFLSMSRLYFMARHIVPVLLGQANPSVPDKRSSPGWKDSMNCLVGIAQQCRQRAIPLVVLHFRMLPDPISNALDQDLGAMAARERFAYCDTLSWFQGRNIRKLTNSFIDTHPNAEGHRILAEGASRFILEQAIAPGHAPLSASTQ